jgi:1-deoxy-D-xylulose-5-phosphate synthase
VITIEDHARAGGFGSAVLECLSDRAVPATVERLGLPDRFIDHGAVDDQWRESGIDVATLVDRALARCGGIEGQK